MGGSAAPPTLGSELYILRVWNTLSLWSTHLLGRQQDRGQQGAHVSQLCLFLEGEADSGQ